MRTPLHVCVLDRASKQGCGPRRLHATRRAMQLALPEFQFRFMAAAGNVIFPGNFHPVGTQVSARAMIERASEGETPSPGAGGRWLVVGGSGGFGSAARVALACDYGAHTFNVSFDQQPNPDSNNKIRKIGSPGYHRNLAIEAELEQRGLHASSFNLDAFDPAARADALAKIKSQLAGQKLDGVVWALAAPKGLDPRTGKAVRSTLKPLGQKATVRTFAAPEPDGDAPIVEFDIEPGTPEEAINTIFVMGGQVVQAWVDDLRDAELLNEGFTLLTISYRGNPLNSNMYRHGLIGLAKADLEFTTRALDAQLASMCQGRALSVEGPAVVTEASGAIPGVPLYMALIADVMGERFEDPLDNMRRLFRDHIMGEATPTLDDEGLLRMDDRELSEPVQAEMRKRFEALAPGEHLPRALFDDFMHAYQQTRGFGVDGVDYAAEFDTDEVCRAP